MPGTDLREAFSTSARPSAVVETSSISLYKMGVGAYDQIAVDGGGHQDALAHLVGHWKMTLFTSLPWLLSRR